MKHTVRRRMGRGGEEGERKNRREEK